MYAPLSESIQQLAGIDGMRAVIEGKCDLFLPGKLAPTPLCAESPASAGRKRVPFVS